MDIISKVPTLGNLHAQKDLESIGFVSTDRRITIDIPKCEGSESLYGFEFVKMGFDLDRFRLMMVTRDWQVSILLTNQHTSKLQHSDRYTLTARLAPHLSWVSPVSGLTIIPYVSESTRFDSTCKNQIKVGV